MGAHLLGDLERTSKVSSHQGGFKSLRPPAVPSTGPGEGWALARSWSAGVIPGTAAGWPAGQGAAPQLSDRSRTEGDGRQADSWSQQQGSGQVSETLAMRPALSSPTAPLGNSSSAGPATHSTHSRPTPGSARAGGRRSLAQDLDRTPACDLWGHQASLPCKVVRLQRDRLTPETQV